MKSFDRSWLDKNPISEIEWICKDEKGRDISNFFPTVLKKIEIKSANGTEYSVELELCFNGAEKSKVILPLREVEKIDWFTLDNRCLVNNENEKKGRMYLANLIRVGAATAPVEIMYKFKKTGIEKIGKTVVFIAGNQVVSKVTERGVLQNIDVNEVPFRLDMDGNISPQDAFAGMRELICLSPEIGRVLVAHVIAGIIRTAFREAGMIPCAVLVIVGKSGMLKSHYVPLLTQLYNRADGIRAVTRFNSSQRFIEDILHEYSDCTAVIDDLNTAESRGIKRVNETTAEEIIRRVSDDIGRGHKEGKALVQDCFRGNVVFIGEYSIGKDSTIPRALIAKLTRQIDGKTLDKYQRQKPLLVSTFYYYFIGWYVENFNDICEEINIRLTHFREKMANINIHGRLCDTQFYLQISYMFFLEFCRCSDFISWEDALDEYNDFSIQLANLIQEQHMCAMREKSDLVKMDYLEMIRNLYQNKKIQLADSEKTFNPDKHDGLIYYDCLCITRKNLEKILIKEYKSIRIGEVTNSLFAQEALRVIGDGRTVKIYTLNKEVGSIRFYAIWLHKLR